MKRTQEQEQEESRSPEVREPGGAQDTGVGGELRVIVTRQIGSAFTWLGSGDRERGRRAIAHLLYRALADTSYGRTPAYGSPAQVLRGDVRGLELVDPEAGPILVLATAGERLVGVFWGDELVAAPAVAEGLRRGAAFARADPHARDLGLDHAGLRASTRASSGEVAELYAELVHDRPRLFYADWVAVAPGFRGAGLGRLLWSLGLEWALAGGPYVGYVARTIRERRTLLERFYCDEIGGRTFFAWEEGGLDRLAFGGARDPRLAAVLATARSSLQVVLEESLGRPLGGRRL